MKMIKLFLLLSVGMVVSLIAKDLKPVNIYTTHGGINDMVVSNGKMYIGTAASRVDIIDLKTKNIDKEIILSKITDFMGDEIESEVFSVDVWNDDILILSQDKNGYSRVDVYKDGKLHHILDKKDALYIVKAKYVTKDTVLFGLLSNVYMLYDLKNKKTIWEEQITMSKFSNYAINDDKTEAATADEGGDVNVISLKDGKKLKRYPGINKDEVFGIDWKKDLIVTGGKDRKVGIYHTNKAEGVAKEYSFFIYSVGISPSAKYVGISVDDKNNVVIFDSRTKEDKYKLIGNKSKIAAIVFLDDETVLVASNDVSINLYKLK